MKRKYADLRNIKDILKSEFKTIKINEINFKAYLSIVIIKDVKKVWEVDVEKRCILNKDYKWLEIHPIDQNYTITAIYNEKDQIIEWYIDICKQNGIEDGIPFEDDLFLDVVIVPDGRIIILDEEELLEAEKNSIITKQDVELAYKVKEKIIKKYGNNIGLLKEITDKLLKKLKDL